jgi:hypothetical protein
VSIFGFDSDQPGDVNSLSIAEVGLAIESLLINRATGGSGLAAYYQELRTRLLAEAPTELVPSFVKACRTLDQFWGYIKKNATYDARRTHIYEAFAPLHEWAEGEDAKSKPAGAVEERGEPPEAESLRPVVTEDQRAVLEALHKIYLDTHDWPTHAYVEQRLEKEGIDLDEELRTMPEQTYSPDRRGAGGMVLLQDSDKVSLMVRGLVACRDVDRELEMLVATVRWAVEAIRSIEQRPHEVVEKTWKTGDVVHAIQVTTGQVPPVYEVKLLLDIMQGEPAPLPRWSGVREAVMTWDIAIPRDIKRFRKVESIDDYLELTARPARPQLQPIDATPSPIGSEAQAVTVAPTSRSGEHPIFGPPQKLDRTFECFVLLPLREPYRSVYELAVKPAAEELGLACGHAEDIYGPGHIMRDVYSSICFASVIVAELTGRNPNVFYELGIAHEQGKQVILLTQNMDDVPFDLLSLRVVPYEWKRTSTDAQSLSKKLKPNMEEALRRARE